MATKTVTTLISVLAIWALTSVESASHHGAPAPAVDCSTVILNMADCLSFVTNDSTLKKPQGACCSGLKTVLKTNAECLCEAFKNSAQLGVTLNVTKALTLPTVCHLSAPSVSNCGLSLGPGAAPALSPMGMSPGSVAAAPTTGAGASEPTPAPAPAPASSGSSAFGMSAASLVFITLVAASFSLF